MKRRCPSSDEIWRDGTCDLPTKLGLIDDERTAVEDRCEAGYCIWSLSLCADGSAQSGTDIQAQGWTQKSKSATQFGAGSRG